MLGEDRTKPLLGHAGSAQDTGPLHSRRGADRNHRIAQDLATSLEQQGYVENHQVIPGPGASLQELLRTLSDKRVENALEAAQCGGIAKDSGTEGGAVDLPIADGARESPFDLVDRAAASAHESVHQQIGVMYRETKTTQHARRRRLAHTDRPSEPKHLHASSPGRIGRNHRLLGVSSTNERSSGVTSGRTPNQVSNPGLA